MAATENSLTPVLLALSSFTPSLALEVLPRGLTIHRLFVQADGRTHDLLVGPESPLDHLSQKYNNTIIGRYANRIPVVASTLSRSGFTSAFTPLPNENPQVSLHGGPSGFDIQEWTPLLDPSEASLFSKSEVDTISSTMPVGSAVIFKRISQDGEDGYPGRLLVEVLVGLVQPSGPQTQKESFNLGSIVLVYRAKLLDENTVTPINLTQHWGFNLDASVRGDDDHDEEVVQPTSVPPVTVKDHKLTIKADHTVELNELSLSTGFLLPVTGTHHAHSEKESGKIGEKWPQSGYDEYYLFSPRDSVAPSRIPLNEFTSSTDLLNDILTKEQKDPVVELEGARSGLKLSFDSNQSGVQFYSNNLTNTSKGSRKKIHGGSGVVGSGDGYDAGSAAFLEFHEPLAAWLNPSTQGSSKNDTLLASGELYNNFVRIDVWFKPPARGNA